MSECECCNQPLPEPGEEHPDEFTRAFWQFVAALTSLGVGLACLSDPAGDFAEAVLSFRYAQDAHRRKR